MYTYQIFLLLLHEPQAAQLRERFELLTKEENTKRLPWKKADNHRLNPVLKLGQLLTLVGVMGLIMRLEAVIPRFISTFHGRADTDDILGIVGERDEVL